MVWDLACSENLEDLSDIGVPLSLLPEEHDMGRKRKQRLSEMDTSLKMGSKSDFVVHESAQSDVEERTDSACTFQDQALRDLLSHLIPSKRRRKVQKAMPFNEGCIDSISNTPSPSAPSSSAMSAARTPECTSPHPNSARFQDDHTASCPEIFTGMLEREQPLDCEDAGETQLIIDLVCRLCAANDFGYATTGLAVRLAAASHKLVSQSEAEWTHELVGAACVWIACKYHENAYDFLTSGTLYKQLKLCNAAGSCGMADWEQKLCHMETKILHSAEWTLEVPTVHSFAQILVRECCLTDIESELRDLLHEVTKLQYSSALGKQPASVLAVGTLHALLYRLGRPGGCLSRFMSQLDREAVQKIQLQISARLWG